MNLSFEDEAKAEFKAAAYYYEEQADGLGERFTAHIEATLTRILANPLLPRCFDGQFRRMKADKFPYVVIYGWVEDQVIIMAVMHTSRRPRYWDSRLKGG